jgi:uncharacterized membrane protein YfcA
MTEIKIVTPHWVIAIFASIVWIMAISSVIRAHKKATLEEKLAPNYIKEMKK